jgi:ATP-dependent Lon protease
LYFYIYLLSFCYYIFFLFNFAIGLLGDALQIANDSGAKKVLIPVVDIINIAKVPHELISKFQLLIYSDPIDAVFKAIGVQ